MKYGKTVNSASELPKGEHWAIITSQTVTIPGDERSRTSPGHGYPESTERYLRYEAFTDEDEFKTELATRLSKRTTYGEVPVGIHVAGSYKTITKVEFEKMTQAWTDNPQD